MVTLKRVSKETALHLPAEMNVDIDRIWLRPGGVVDVDDPFTKHCIKGQEYKLEPASSNAKVTPLRDGRLLAFREEWLKKKAKKKKAAAMEANVEEDDPDLDDGDPDNSDPGDEADDDEPVVAGKEATAGGEIQKPDKAKRGAKKD